MKTLLFRLISVLFSLMLLLTTAPPDAEPASAPLEPAPNIIAADAYGQPLRVSGYDAPHPLTPALAPAGSASAGASVSSPSVASSPLFIENVGQFAPSTSPTGSGQAGARFQVRGGDRLMCKFAGLQ